MTEEKKETQNTEQPLKVEVVERLTNDDKSALDLLKAKREIASSNAKVALAQIDIVELTYKNIILQLAMKYGLVDGDTINDDGTIARKK